MDHKITIALLRPICCVCSLVITGTVLAAPPTLQQQLGPGREVLDVPEFKEPAEQPKFKLPTLKQPSPETDGRVLRILVKKFELTGNKVFSDEELAKITEPYENRILTTVEIQEVRQKLTLYYINNGYINSGALLPDQKISNGIVKMTIVEGELTRIDVKGNTDLNTDYISDRLALGGVTPLNLKTMQQQLRFMQQNPLIKQVNAELTPGDKPGESILKVKVEENRPYSFATFIDNYHSPSIGSFGLGIEAVHRNLSGRGDQAIFRFSKTEGLDDGFVSYAIPLNPQDTIFRIRYQGSNTEVIEEPFDQISIKSKARTYGIELTHPVVKTADTEVVLGIGLDKRKNESTLLGEPFSFSLGVDDGLSRVTALRLSQSYNNQSQNEAISLRSVFSFGFDAFDATVHSTPAEIEAVCGPGNDADTCPDAIFSAWLGQFQYVRRFNAYERNMNLVVRADAQIASESLLPVEQFSVGGVRSVRGYRENQLVRDNGFNASVELRIPFIIGGGGASIGTSIQLVPFIDYGRSWNDGRTTPEPSTLSSAGLGVLWTPDRHWRLEAYAAKNFHEIVGESDEHDLQDSGLHFQLSYSH